MIDLSILKKPLVTEKSSQNMEKGVYTFLVNRDTSKVAVKQAFEKLFGEKVTTVRMTIIEKKTRLIGKGKLMEKRSQGKKAVITLKDHKKVDIFQTSKTASKEAKK